MSFKPETRHGKLVLDTVAENLLAPGVYCTCCEQSRVVTLTTVGIVRYVPRVFDIGTVNSRLQAWPVPKSSLLPIKVPGDNTPTTFKSRQGEGGVVVTSDQPELPRIIPLRYSVYHLLSVESLH